MQIVTNQFQKELKKHGNDHFPFLVSHHNLEVMLVSYRHTPAALYSLIEEF